MWARAPQSIVGTFYLDASSRISLRRLVTWMPPLGYYCAVLLLGARLDCSGYLDGALACSVLCPPDSGWCTPDRLVSSSSSSMF
ncbi:hypothetical protein BV25DRAFT_1824282 [Artomyces pyxidatus]|uniref:Uncharacterized protein n=1 Tax=Artomyces pyxidatus TaxID=48021 RepID=A0ACB8T5G2_9AGAM|nr:hypothetical protein BV25DRAFT_1824282 [Artomyces pyxidatus]